MRYRYKSKYTKKTHQSDHLLIMCIAPAYNISKILSKKLILLEISNAIVTYICT